MDKKKGIELRKSYLGKSRRVVVKVGSAVLTGEDGLDRKVM
ncbi:MAG: glutamate 5-kinase, partial [Deltaproteobacteria bacterium]|nr:glutamate 5-kinase [Deltaproteobacteria bacterium]